MRPSIEQHAERMEAELVEHDWKSHWHGESSHKLLQSITGLHEKKLINAVCENNHSEVIKQATHISNYCMMLADKACIQKELKRNPERGT